MNDRKYYRAALEYAFLDGAALEERINERIATLPKRREVRVRMPKRLILALVAAAVLLIAGTALAVTISRMQEVRDVGIEKLGEMADYVNDAEHPDAAAPDNTLTSSGSVPIAVGTRDENGNWQPQALSELNEAVQVGSFTVRLDSINYYTNNDDRFIIECFLESESSASYRFAPFSFSINGSETVTNRESVSNAETQPASPVIEAGQSIPISLTFQMEQKNPFRPGTTFMLSSELNGQPFTLTYELTKERFEQLRQNMLTDLDNYATQLRNVPEESIPLGIECNGRRIIDIAVKDHWMYFTSEPIKEYWEGREGGSDPLPYGSFDQGGLWPVIDSMYCPDEFISSKRTGEGIRDYIELSRIYLPYGEELPEQSLVSIWGANFRIEWATATVTMPKDETEWLAWRQECEAIAGYYDDDKANFVAKLDAKAETFTVTDLVYMNRTGLKGTIGLVLETETAVKRPFKGQDRQPVVTINGTVLEGMMSEYGTVDSYIGGTENGGKRVGFVLYGPAYRILPEVFDVTVTWNGSTVTYTMHKYDLIRCYEGEEASQQFYEDYFTVFGL